MKKESRTQQNKESLNNQQPVDPRSGPFPRDSRAPASREILRGKLPVVFRAAPTPPARRK